MSLEIVSISHWRKVFIVTTVFNYKAIEKWCKNPVLTCYVWLWHWNCQLDIDSFISQMDLLKMNCVTVLSDHNHFLLDSQYSFLTNVPAPFLLFSWPTTLRFSEALFFKKMFFPQLGTCISPKFPVEWVCNSSRVLGFPS